MEIDLRTTEVTAIIANPDGTVSYETRPRETPLDFTDQHHEIIDAQWQSVRIERDRRIAATDWIVARAYERGEQVPVEWTEYRQALRDITKQANPFFVVWPDAPAIQVPPTPPTVPVQAAENPPSA